MKPNPNYIFYDNTNNKLLDIYFYDIEENYNAGMVNPYGGTKITVQIDFDYVNEWFAASFDLSGRMTSKKEYARDIFIVGRNKTHRLIAAFPSSIHDVINRPENKKTSKVDIQYDYVESGMKEDYPQLLAILREEKLKNLLDLSS